MKNFYLLLLFLVLPISHLNAQFSEGDSVVVFWPDGVIDHHLIDFDNDDDYDLLNFSYNSIKLYENLGDENFELATSILTDIEGGIYYSGIELSEINGDGLMDFVAYYQEGEFIRKISTFENNGDGSFTKIDLLEDYVHDVVLFDDDADGDDELFFITSLELHRLEGNGDGTFGPDLIISASGMNFNRMFHTDFDYDGDRDIIVNFHEFSDALVYFENLGDGAYAPFTIIMEDLPSAANWAQFVDGDGDGDEDWLIGTGDEYNAINYYENLGGSLAEPYLVHPGVKGFSRMADLNLDGLPDIVSPDGSSKHQWFENLGDGTFSDAIPIPEVPITDESAVLNGSPNIEVVDIDGDGDMEVCGEASQAAFFYVIYDNILADTYSASGTFYADFNENGIQDEDESGISFPVAMSSPDETGSYTAPDGDFTIGFETGVEETYVITPQLPDGWLSTPENYEILVDGVSEWSDLDFGIFPAEIIDSISTSLVGAYPRCSESVTYWAGVQNLGSTQASGVIDVELDEVITYYYCEIEPDSIVGQHIYWHFDSLMWFEDFVITFQVVMPDFEFAGEEVISSINSSIINESEEIIFSDEDILSQIIVCAYDPNDKTVAPLGTDEVGYIDVNTEWLEYIIRFQNTGTDTAQHIIIEDLLDANLDVLTLDVLSSSHDMNYAFEDDLVSFDFDNIMLPDSGTNFVASQGYVQFRIKIIEGLEVGTVIENSADIYFDFNPPITTNATINTLFDCETILENVELPINVCFGQPIDGTTIGEPIPSTTEFTWTSIDDVIIGPSYTILPEIAGEYEITVTASTDFCEADELFVIEIFEEVPITYLEAIELCDGDSVSIFDEYQTIAGIYTESLTTEFGCDSIISVELVVNELPEVSIAPLDDEILCLNWGSIDLLGTPEGGVFTGDGMDENTFDPAVSGIGEFVIYYSYEDENLCSSIDSVFILVEECLGLTEKTQEVVRIFPNPFKNQTTLHFTENIGQNHQLIIQNFLGQVVYQINVDSGSSMTINRGNLASGSYVISILDDSSGAIVWKDKILVD